MADVSYTLLGTVKRAAADAVAGSGLATHAKVINATRSVTARAVNDTMKMVRLPSNARLSMLSKAYWDDLASSGSPTLSIGLASVGNNITTSATALNSGLDLSAAGSGNMLSDHANAGKTLWELAGATSDPGGFVDIYFTFAAAVTNVTGDVSAEVVYTLD